jgi:Family of unknown function (DUF6065)
LTVPDPQLPTVEFFLLNPEVRPPEPASRDVRGSLPARAARICPPVTAAASFGWYVFPPIDFALRWDGHGTDWSPLTGNEPDRWRSLAGGRDALLTHTRRFLDAAPEGYQEDLDIFDYVERTIPFMDADPLAANQIELISGLVARTSPGWCLLSRGVPNWPGSYDHQVLEGVVETDWYRGYVPTMIRLTRQDRVVRFYRDQPVMVVQPIPRIALAATGRDAVRYQGIGAFPDDAWREFVAARRRRQGAPGAGSYAAERRRRAGPHAHTPR